eukprot:14009993-Alexandrium_andersonii.AAC.1
MCDVAHQCLNNKQSARVPEEHTYRGAQRSTMSTSPKHPCCTRHAARKPDARKQPLNETPLGSDGCD